MEKNQIEKMMKEEEITKEMEALQLNLAEWSYQMGLLDQMRIRMKLFELNISYSIIKILLLKF